LLESTPRQILLQRLLGLPTPRYAHLPVAANAHGEKLSKQTLAPPVDQAKPARELVNVLKFLRQQPPPALEHASVADVWNWAATHWQRERLLAVRATCFIG
jgi:glutamyl-Q tRNA(Asp) synthetase